MDTNTSLSTLVATATAFQSMSPTQMGQSLFGIFKTVAQMNLADAVAFYQTAHTVYEQAMEGSEGFAFDSEKARGFRSVADQMAQMRMAAVSRMVSLCLQVEGRERCKLYKECTAALQCSVANRSYDDNSPERCALATVPLPWFGGRFS